MSYYSITARYAPRIRLLLRPCEDVVPFRQRQSDQKCKLRETAGTIDDTVSSAVCNSLCCKLEVKFELWQQRFDFTPNPSYCKKNDKQIAVTLRKLYYPSAKLRLNPVSPAVGVSKLRENWNFRSITVRGVVA